VSAGAVTLGQVARRMATLEVACRRCDRRGRYSTARLVGQHGAAMGLPELRVAPCRFCCLLSPRRR
jgi:hypothetical protein